MQLNTFNVNFFFLNSEKVAFTFTSTQHCVHIKWLIFGPVSSLLCVLRIPFANLWLVSLNGCTLFLFFVY